MNSLPCRLRSSAPCLLSHFFFSAFVLSADPLETCLCVVGSASKPCLFCRQHYYNLVRMCSLMVCLLKQKVSAGPGPAHLSAAVGMSVAILFNLKQFCLTDIKAVKLTS